MVTTKKNVTFYNLTRQINNNIKSKNNYEFLARASGYSFSTLGCHRQRMWIGTYHFITHPCGMGSRRNCRPGYSQQTNMLRSR